MPIICIFKCDKNGPSFTQIKFCIHRKIHNNAVVMGIELTKDTESLVVMSKMLVCILFPTLKLSYICH